MSPEADLGVLLPGLAFMSPGPFLLGLVRLGSFLGLVRTASEPPFLGLVRFASFFGLVRTASFLGLVRLGAALGLVRTAPEPDLGLVRLGVASLPGLVRTGADSDGAFLAGALADERSEGALEAGALERDGAGAGFDRAGLELGLLLEDPLLAWKWQPPSAIAKMATLAAGLSVRWMSFIVVVVPLGGPSDGNRRNPIHGWGAMSVKPVSGGADTL